MLGIRFYKEKSFDIWQGTPTDFVCNALILSPEESQKNHPTSHVFIAEEKPLLPLFLKADAQQGRHVACTFQAFGSMPQEKIVATIEALSMACQAEEFPHLQRFSFLVQTAEEHAWVQTQLELHFAEAPSWHV